MNAFVQSESSLNQEMAWRTAGETCALQTSCVFASYSNYYLLRLETVDVITAWTTTKCTAYAIFNISLGDIWLESKSIKYSFKLYIYTYTKLWQFLWQKVMYRKQAKTPGNICSCEGCIGVAACGEVRTARASYSSWAPPEDRWHRADSWPWRRGKGTCFCHVNKN